MNIGLGNIIGSLERRGIKVDQETKDMIWSAMKDAAQREGIKPVGLK